MTKKWLSRLYIPAILLIMTVGVIFILKMGYKPAPTDIMAPSFFDQPEEIGHQAFRRFFAPLQEKNRIAIGVPPQPEWYRKVISGFLAGAAKEGHPFEVVVQEIEMPDLDLSATPNTMVVKVHTNIDPPAEIVDVLQKLEADHKRVLVYLPSLFTAHVLTASPIHRIERALQTNLFSISVGPLSLRADQEYLIDPPCVGTERDANGTADFGCLLMQSGRMLYRKKVPQERFVAIMNEPKPEDYVLMISEPGQDKWDSKTRNTELRMSPPAAAAAPGN